MPGGRGNGECPDPGRDRKGWNCPGPGMGNAGGWVGGGEGNTGMPWPCEGQQGGFSSLGSHVQSDLEKALPGNHL